MADRIVHFDISGPELAPMAKFYSEMFGWNVGSGEGGYAQVETGGLRGGLMESESAGLNIGIQVEDLEDALKRTVALGGKVVMPITDNGWVVKAQVCDPAGNLVSLIQADAKPVS